MKVTGRGTGDGAQAETGGTLAGDAKTIRGVFFLGPIIQIPSNSQEAVLVAGDDDDVGCDAQPSIPSQDLLHRDRILDILKIEGLDIFGAKRRSPKGLEAFVGERDNFTERLAVYKLRRL